MSTLRRNIPENLARIHQVFRVESFLEHTHHVDRIAQFLLEEVDLAKSDPVFTGTGSVEGNRAFNHAAVNLFGSLHFIGIGGVDEYQHMKIAVTDMPNDRCDQARLGQIRFRLEQAFREP
jgi:hypothetical protein